MPKQIVNIAELEMQPRTPQFAPTGPAAERYDARVAFIATRIGAKKLGYNLTAVPPGKRAYPFHSHRVQEEMFFVLEARAKCASEPRRFRSVRATSSRVRPAGRRPLTRSSTPARPSCAT